MRRREVIAGLGVSAFTGALAARAQQPAMPVVEYIDAGSSTGSAHFVAAFREGLSKVGYFEGRNVTVEYRWADGNNDNLREFAFDLVRRQVSVIAAPGSTAAALAAKGATSSIPIIFTTGADPVTAGLVPSLNRPGGNVTGVATLNLEVAPKRLELMHELIKGVPHLIVCGDYMDQHPVWPRLMGNPNKWAQAIAAAGGKADTFDLPKLGITGNTHMMMMDRNSDEVAELINDWLAQQGLVN
jgi:hypothetical protein